MNKIVVFIFMLSILGTGCATYNYASSVKMISFDDNLSKGQSIGPVRGEDCTVIVMGIMLGGFPTLDKAIINAKTMGGTEETYGYKKAKNTNVLRYMNNVSTEYDGFNAIIFGNQCLVAKGVGYK